MGNDCIGFLQLLDVNVSLFAGGFTISSQLGRRLHESYSATEK